MKFLVDAQLPRKLAQQLNYRGYDTLHTLDLPHQNRSKDSELNYISMTQKRILVSKDMDFVESKLISNKPYKLLYVNIGNIHNKELQAVFANSIEMIVTLFEENTFIELTRENLIVHM